MPAGPAPTTATRFGSRAGSTVTSSSWQANGFTRHDAICIEKMWSRQAWLQAMQVLIASARPAAALLTKSASARNGRAIDTMSASPRAMTSSATCGSLMRLDATSGIDTLPIRRRVTWAKAARGTLVMIVGTRASCQPMPLLMMFTPACSSACASATTSSQLLPSSTRSIIETRNTMMKSRPTRSRTARTTSSPKRMRFSNEPPQRSLRWLVRGAMNSLIR